MSTMLALLPLLLVIALLGSGRAGALVAGLAGLGATIAVTGASPALLMREVPAGLWLSFQVIAIIATGIFFHHAQQARGRIVRDGERGDAAAAVERLLPASSASRRGEPHVGAATLAISLERVAADRAPRNSIFRNAAASVWLRSRGCRRCRSLPRGESRRWRAGRTAPTRAAACGARVSSSLINRTPGCRRGNCRACAPSRSGGTPTRPPAAEARGVEQLAQCPPCAHRACPSRCSRSRDL